MTLKVSAPVMGVTLLVGVVISAFQALTQINEASLSFIPKALAALAALALFGPWMLNTLVMYTATLFDNLPALVR